MLPYRIQDQFAPLHKLAGLELSLPVDSEDILFDPVMKEAVTFNGCMLLPIENMLVSRYAAEFEKEIAKFYTKKVFFLTIRRP